MQPSLRTLLILTSAEMNNIDDLATAAFCRETLDPGPSFRGGGGVCVCVGGWGTWHKPSVQSPSHSKHTAHDNDTPQVEPKRRDKELQASTWPQSDPNLSYRGQA